MVVRVHKSCRCSHDSVFLVNLIRLASFSSGVFFFYFSNAGMPENVQINSDLGILKDSNNL